MIRQRHATNQGERYTITESARRTVLDHLLAANHQRYEEQVKAGLHDKGERKRKKASQRRGPHTRVQAELIPPSPQQLL
jgi:hypothetical protein